MSGRERWAWTRFLMVVTTAAVGEALGVWQRLPSSDLAIPLVFGGAAYYLTLRLNGPRYRRDANVRYWRGRRIDGD